jgi:hypothetical protein
MSVNKRSVSLVDSSSRSVRASPADAHQIKLLYAKRGQERGSRIEGVVDEVVEMASESSGGFWVSDGLFDDGFGMEILGNDAARGSERGRRRRPRRRVT